MPATPFQMAINIAKSKSLNYTHSAFSATKFSIPGIRYSLRSTFKSFGISGLRGPAFQTVVVQIMAKVLYAASAWWGFTSASDRQRTEAFVGRAKRCELCYADQLPVLSLVEDADDKLFANLLHLYSYTRTAG